MQVVILAGGMGTRLRPLTNTIPKAMVTVRGKPFLEHQLGLLKATGLTDVLILAGYLGGQIEEYFGDGSALGVRIGYSHEQSPMGTGGALKIAEPALEEHFVLLNGDTLLPIDYRALVDAFGGSGTTGLIVAYSNTCKIAANNLKLSNQDLVLAYNKDDDTGMTHVDAGAIVLDKSVLELIRPGRPCSLEREVFRQLIRKRQLKAFRTDQRFYDMGSIEGLKQIEKVLR